MRTENHSPTRGSSPKRGKQEFIIPSRRSLQFQARDTHGNAAPNTSNGVSNASPSPATYNEAEILQKLEQKRLELDALITEYIVEKQKEYDEFERDLYQNIPDNTATNIDTTTAEELTDSPDATQNERGRIPNKPEPLALTLPLSRPIWTGSPQSSPIQMGLYTEDRTPVHEREKELHDLFTPFFIPLLDAGSSHRSNSAPPVPTATREAATTSPEGYKSDSDALQQVRRSEIESPVKPTPSKKSALRSPKKPRDRKKRVSLIIDDEIVHPSESPKESHILVSAKDDDLDDLASEGPNVAIMDPEGPPVYVWVPEKARLPYPDEDALDYVMAVGGTLHHSAEPLSMNHYSYRGTETLPSTDSEEPGKDETEGAPLQRFPSDSLHSPNSATHHGFDWSSSPKETMFNMSPEIDRKAPLRSHPPDTQTTQPPSLSHSHNPSPPKPPSPSKERASSPISSPTTTSPPRSPVSPSSRHFNHHPSYIDKFSNDPHRLFGNLGATSVDAPVSTSMSTLTSTLSPTSTSASTPTPQTEPPPNVVEEASLAYQDTGGPTSSYVGGIDGSGVDAVDIGSVGYPSSMGASYLEKFAAERAMGLRARRKEEEDEKEKDEDEEGEEEKLEGSARGAVSSVVKPKDERELVDEDEFLGEMEDV